MSSTPHELYADDNITLSSSSPRADDLIFLPTGSDENSGTLNIRVLGGLGLDSSAIPASEELAGGHAFIQSGNLRFCFVDTSEKGGVKEVIERNLREALLDKQLADASSLWIPLFGSGADRMSLDDSRKLIVEAVTATGWRGRPDVHIAVAFPPNDLISLDGLADLDVDESVNSLLDFAATLSIGYKDDASISTTLLLLSLAESQGRAAPELLRASSTARLLSGALHDLAGSRYGVVRDEYFPKDRRAARGVARIWPARLTPTVLKVIRHAAKAAGDSGTLSVFLTNVITTLVSFPEGRHRLCLERMGISMPDLARVLEDAVAGQVGTKLFNDIAAVKDRLGYERYATAIKKFLLDEATQPPLSISIQAPWGVGKSSLMRQIREMIDPSPVRNQNRRKPGSGDGLTVGGALAFLNRADSAFNVSGPTKDHLWSVWFNAWKYNTSEQVWAGLVDAIVSEISMRLSPADRELFLFRLQLSRIDDGIVRRKIYDRIVTIWWARIRRWAIGGVAFAASWLGFHHVLASVFGSGRWLDFAAFSPVAAGGICLTAYAWTNFGSVIKTTKSEPASFSLAEYLQVPDYGRSVGAIHQIHHDLSRVLDLVPRRSGESEAPPIVIFIDDLDRCSPTKIADVVEGVSMFLADDDYRCMFVIGMDPQVIAAALEEAHSKVRARLPTYEQSVPLGWRFMDKVIQLPFTIPPTRRGNTGDFVGWLTDIDPRSTTNVESSPQPEDAGTSHSQAASEANTGTGHKTEDKNFSSRTGSESQPSVANESSDTSQRVREAVRSFRESRDVGELIKAAAEGISTNPRELKRLANLARLYLQLRNTRRECQSAWQSPAVARYARWISLTLRWPDLMRWLLWGADEGTWPADQASIELVVRRLQILENEASSAQTNTEWSSAVKGTLGLKLDESLDWTCDQRLFEFFLNESKYAPEERLSTAVSHEFW